MRCLYLGVVFLIVIGLPLYAADDVGLLLNWTFDDGPAGVAKDLSTNRLDGTVTAAWVSSPRGKAVSLDGSSRSLVRTAVPEALRFGQGSWSFTAWLRPEQLGIADSQNQRRIFSFGKYPDANLVIDIRGDGAIMHYFCYHGADGKVVGRGGTSALRVATNTWFQVAVVCDRETGRVHAYVNGFSSGSSELGRDFGGDFSLGGELTVGSGWHNYRGLVDDVRIYRRALSETEMQDAFDRLKSAYGAKALPEAVAARRRERLDAALTAARRAWADGDYEAVRRAYGTVMAEKDAPAVYRGYAHLRTARSYTLQKKLAEARAAYASVAADRDYPLVQRDEARACLRELDRVAAGLPARDPTVSRANIKPVASFAAEVFVAPGGDDGHAGTADAPLATPTAARDAVRALRRDGVAGPIAVTFRPGQYTLTDTFELTAADSGSSGDAPVVYRAGEEGQAVMYGGRRISGFAPVEDESVLDRLPEEARGKVMRCDLRALGITDYGELKVRGFAQPPSPPTLELFFNGRPMTPARWPNEGFVGIRKLVSEGVRSQGTPSIFEYESDRHARWTKAKDAWLFGYFHFLWADATIKIGHIDPATRTLTTAEPYNYGGRGMSTQQGIVYYAFNLLEELDRPGEWYLDRETGVLYLYPPSTPDAATIELGMLATPMVRMRGVAHVRLEGLGCDLARYNGVVMEDCQDCLLVGCAVTRLAGNGVMVHGGRRDGILGCDISVIGRRAAEVIGGDRATLTPGEHFVENCRIHDFGRIDRTYTPAIQLEGVGNRAAHNLMYDCPSSVMRIEGNDHVIEYNDVHDAVCESDDQGAMELFGNPSYRGVVFRYNRFRNVGKTGTEPAVHGQAAIRFDDAISGMIVYGNIFEHSANGHFGAVQLNSGRDNVIDNNVFIDCKQGVSGGWNRNNSVWRALREGKPSPKILTNALYIARYPELATMLEESAVNHIWRNVFYRCGQPATGNPAYLDLFGNVESAAQDIGKADPAALEAVGLSPIPLNEIGVYGN